MTTLETTVSYAGSKSSLVQIDYISKPMIDFRKQGPEVRSYTEGEVRVPDVKGWPTPAYFPDQSSIDRQVTEMNGIRDELTQLGFNVEDYGEDYVKLIKNGIEISLIREETVKQLYLSGYKKRARSIFSLVMSVGIEVLEPHQYQEAMGKYSNLSYWISVKGNEEEQLLASELDTKLKKQHNFK